MLPRSILPPSYEQTHGHARRIELASDRVIRERNKISYRLNHWPIWIFVFFIAPGPMTFSLFEHGFNVRMAAWMSVVLIGTGVAGLFGKLPGVEPRPYIIRFTEDRPNPLYRRICYTMAWSEAVTFAVLNITAPVLLWLRLGGLHRAARPVADVEGAAAHPERRGGQARHLRRHPPVGRQHGAARPAPAHASHRPRRARRLGLIRT